MSLPVLLGGQTPLQTLHCSLVNNISQNSAEQCKFVLDNGCLELDAVIDYVSLVYCDLGLELRPISLMLLLVLSLVLFVSLSAVADEFLCPSLLSVARNLRMSDSLAGVTLLAFGNGCPDIFASLAAASDDRPELIVGELLGAGIFCTSVVGGLVLTKRDFKLATRPVLRDAIFYLMTIYLMWSYCWAEEISFYGSLAFIFIYVIYLLVALSGQAIHSRMTGGYAISSLANNNDNVANNRSQDSLSAKSKQVSDCEDITKVESLRIKFKTKRGQLLVFSKDDLYNKNKIEKSLQMENNNQLKLMNRKLSLMADPNNNSISSTSDLMIRSLPTKSQEISDINHHHHHVLNIQTNNQDNHHTDLNHLCHDHQKQKHLSKNPLPLLEQLSSISAKENFLTKQQVFPIHLQQDNSTTIQSAIVKSPSLSRTGNEWDQFLWQLSPVQGNEWSEMSCLSRITLPLRAPLMLAAKLTVPLVDQERPNRNWSRPMAALHMITVPLCLQLRFCLHQEANNVLGIPFPVFVFPFSLLLAIVVLRTSTNLQPPSYHNCFAYLGFVMSINWTYMLAVEIVSLLKTVGVIFSMSDTAIGLGILAWGNSLGDLVANLSLCEAGYPRMALGASLGAPLLNTLLGFGLSHVSSLRPGETILIKYSATITLLCTSLAIILFTLMIATILPSSRSRKPFGYFLISGYLIYLGLAVCLEYDIL